jgi:hypothetical protein
MLEPRLLNSAIADPKLKSSSLPLLMFRVDANHSHHALAVDDFALIAHFLD